MFFRTLSAAAAATLLFSAALGLTACDDDDNKTVDTPTAGKLNFKFENVVGSQALTLGSPYTTLAGEPLTVTKFSYIVSNFKLTKADGSFWAEPESYHLVKQSDAGSRNFTVAGIPPGDYTGLTFTIGVDAARNTSGAQTGALSQDNDMYWDWNSGYIFLKLEGNSSAAPNNGGYMFHVGGFKDPYNSLRTVSLPLPAGTAALPVRLDKTPELHLKADVQRIFAGRYPVSLARMHSTGHGADSSAVKLAINYAAGMFRIDHVQSGD